MPYVLINTGMLPHQFMAFLEGLLAPLHSEFERTPKAAAVVAPGARGRPAAATGSVRVHWPYIVAEAVFIAYQLGWGSYSP